MILAAMKPARLLLTAALCAGFASPEAGAQGAYPNRVVRIVAPTSPGGAVDVVARIIAQGLSRSLERQV